MADLWYPGAVRDPGPLSKQGYWNCRTRLGKGAVIHSMEGRLQGALARLDSSDQASWHFSIPYVGGVLQHLPLPAVAWHAGGYANRRWFGVECEGRVGEPLTPQQFNILVDLLRWAAKVEEWPGFVWEKNTGTLHAHSWYMPTACPSSRIPRDRLIAELAPAPDDERVLLQARLGLIRLLSDPSNPDAFQQVADVMDKWLNVRAT